MSAALWDSMVSDAKKRVTSGDVLVSGGAAWADHLAVKLFLDGSVKGLALHLPAPIAAGIFTGPERSSAGSAANYYHGLFKRITGVDGMKEIDTAIARGALVTYEPEAAGYAAMYARNKKVSDGSNAVLAYTFGAGDIPADGGTKATWDQSKAVSKVHVDLGAMGAGMTAASKAPNASSSPVPMRPAEKPAQRPWMRSGQGGAAPATCPSAPSEAVRTRLVGLGRRPPTPRPR